MSVDSLDFGIGEEAANVRVRLAGLGQQGIDHHSVGAEPPQRKHARRENRRNLINMFRGLGLALADEIAWLAR